MKKILLLLCAIGLTLKVAAMETLEEEMRNYPVLEGVTLGSLLHDGEHSLLKNLNFYYGLNPVDLKHVNYFLNGYGITVVKILEDKAPGNYVFKNGLHVNYSLTKSNNDDIIHTRHYYRFNHAKVGYFKLKYLSFNVCRLEYKDGSQYDMSDIKVTTEQITAGLLTKVGAGAVALAGLCYGAKLAWGYWNQK